MLIENTGAGDAPVRSAQRVIHNEQSWLILPEDCNRRDPGCGLTVSRWEGCTTDPHEAVAEIKADSYVLGIALRPMEATFFSAQKCLHDGRIRQGMMRLNEPGCSMRGIFRGGYDVLHVHIPAAMIEAFGTETDNRRRRAAMLLGDEALVVDPVVGNLAKAMMQADEIDGGFGRQYADGVGLALVARLLARDSHSGPSVGTSRTSGLPKWRLKRAVDYVSAHLGEPISLADLAASTGLTRMHFAAQFRASTGLRPHEYLLRRRIERAQELLAKSRMPLIEVAFEVGFSTQAHFTTVFTRFAGETPNAWRRRVLASA